MSSSDFLVATPSFGFYFLYTQFTASYKSLFFLKAFRVATRCSHESCTTARQPVLTKGKVLAKLLYPNGKQHTQFVEAIHTGNLIHTSTQHTYPVSVLARRVSCTKAVPIVLTPHSHVPQPPTRLTTSHDSHCTGVIGPAYAHGKRPAMCEQSLLLQPKHTQPTCGRLRVSTTTSPSCVLPNIRVGTLAECQFVSLSDVSWALLQVLLHIVAEPSKTSPRRSVHLPIT
jgi:hypothetical protein